MRKKVTKQLLGILGGIITIGIYSQANAFDGSGGDVASNLTQMTSFFTGIFSSVFYVIGAMMVMASVIQYRDFRQNPSQTPLSRVIVLLVGGIIIGFFPLGSAWVSQHLAQFNA